MTWRTSLLTFTSSFLTRGPNGCPTCRRAMTTLLETSQISPPPGIVAEQSLPLTFSDINWLKFHPIRRLIFYEFPCSNLHFLETIVPHLKQSLSIALKHFFPLTGNILYPLNSDDLPVIRYTSGDSVSLTIAESSGDLDSFVANHPRDADKFYDLIPQLPPMIHESGCKLLQVLALQVTLFPGAGLCIGVANHHTAGDASSIAAFLNSWASINKLGGETEFLNSRFELLPVFDRSLFKHPPDLDSHIWNLIRKFTFTPPSFPLPTNRVRATFVLTRPELEKLKRSIQSKVVDLGHVSSFVAMSAYIWSCLAKSSPADVVGNDRLEFFLLSVDARARLDPPVPNNYFGNCLAPALTKVGRGELISDFGIFAAAQAIAKAIRDRVSDKKKIFEGAENWLDEIGSAVQGSSLGVSGSARTDLYGVDFGWGRAKKIEVLSIDGEKYAFSVCKARDFEGGMEIGLSLPKVKMEAFHACFVHGLKNL